MTAARRKAVGGNLASYDDALALLLHRAAELGDERVSLEDALGRTLARPIVARLASPRGDVSAMDGYAVSDADLGVTPVRLRIWGESFPARPTECRAGNGRAVRLFTGAPLPGGADRVIVQEDVVRAGRTALFPPADGSKTHVRIRGSDFEQGDVLVAAGVQIEPRHLLVAAAADLETLDVIRRPRVAIVATGDELVRPGKAATNAASLPDSITSAIAALVARWGGECVAQSIIGDDAVAIIDGLGAVDADIIVLCGGASVGDRDSSRAAAGAIGMQPLFTGVAVKPGKPVWAGSLGDKRIVGLPGNPVAAFTMARLFLAPLIATMAGRPASHALDWRSLPLLADLVPNGPRETFLFACETTDGVIIGARQDASAQVILGTADTIVRRLPFAPFLAAGTSVPTLRL